MPYYLLAPISQVLPLVPSLLLPLPSYQLSLQDVEYSQETLEEIVRGIGSNSRKRRLYSTVQARKLLSGSQPPIREFLKAGILQPLIPHVQQRQE